MAELYNVYGETLEGIITKWDPLQLGQHIELPQLPSAFWGPADWADYQVPYILEEQRANLWNEVSKYVAVAGGGGGSGGCGGLRWRMLQQPVADVAQWGWDDPCRSWTVNLKFDLRQERRQPPIKRKDVVLLTNNPAVGGGQGSQRARNEPAAVLALGVVRGMPNAGETYVSWNEKGQRAPYDIAVYAPYGSALAEALKRSLPRGTSGNGSSWYIAYVGSMAPYSRMYDCLQSWQLDPAAAPSPLMKLLLGFPAAAELPAAAAAGGDEAWTACRAAEEEGEAGEEEAQAAGGAAADEEADVEEAWDETVDYFGYGYQEEPLQPSKEGAAVAVSAAAAASHIRRHHQRRIIDALQTAVRSYCKDVLQVDSYGTVVRLALAQVGLGQLADQQLAALSPSPPGWATAHDTLATDVAMWPAGGMYRPNECASESCCCGGHDSSGSGHGSCQVCGSSPSSTVISSASPRGSGYGHGGDCGEGLQLLPIAPEPPAAAAAAPAGCDWLLDCSCRGGGNEGRSAEIVLVQGPPLLPFMCRKKAAGGDASRAQLLKSASEGRAASVAGLLSVLCGLSPPARTVIACAHGNDRVAQLATGMLTQLRRPRLQLAGSGLLQKAGLRPMGPPIRTGDCVALLAADAKAQTSSCWDLNLTARTRRLFDALHGADGWFGTLLQLRQLLGASDAQLREWHRSAGSSGSGFGAGQRAATEPHLLSRGGAGSQVTGGLISGLMGEYLKVQLPPLLMRLRQQAAVLKTDMPSVAWAQDEAPQQAAAIVGGNNSNSGSSAERGLALLEELLQCGSAVEWELGLLSAEQVQEAVVPPAELANGGDREAAAGGSGSSSSSDEGGADAVAPLVGAMRRLQASLEACRGLPNCRLRLGYQDQNRSTLVTALAAIWGPEGWMHVVPELQLLAQQLSYGDYGDLSNAGRQRNSDARNGNQLKALLERLAELASALESSVPQGAWVGTAPGAAAGSPDTARSGRALLAKLATACCNAAALLLHLDAAAVRQAMQQAMWQLQQRQQQLNRKVCHPNILGTTQPWVSSAPHGTASCCDCSGDPLAEAFSDQVGSVLELVAALEGCVDLRGVVSLDALKMFCLDNARLLFCTVSGLGKDDLRRSRALHVADTCLLDGANQVTDVELVPLMGQPEPARGGFGGVGGCAGAAPVPVAAAAPRLLVLVAEPAGNDGKRQPQPRVMSSVAWSRGYGWSVFDTMEWRGWPVWDLLVPGAAVAGGGAAAAATAVLPAAAAIGGGGGGGDGGRAVGGFNRAPVSAASRQRAPSSQAKSPEQAGPAVSWSSDSSLSSWPTVAEAAAPSVATAAAAAVGSAKCGKSVNVPIAAFEQQPVARDAGPKTWAAATTSGSAAVKVMVMASAPTAMQLAAAGRLPAATPAVAAAPASCSASGSSRRAGGYQAAAAPTSWAAVAAKR